MRSGKVSKRKKVKQQIQNENKRIALEMELREVTKSFKKKLAKSGADLERANARVEKVKGTVKEWEVSIPFYITQIYVLFKKI